MKAGIKAITYHLPEKVITNEELSRQFPNVRMEDLTRLTGVYRRHVAAPDETASDLAFQSAEKLFDEYNIDRSEIDFLIYCSSIADYFTPPTSCILQHRLRLSNDTGTYDFNQGCTAYIHGLAQAKGLIESGQAKNVLLLTAETISKKIHPKDKSNLAIFGDGAAATLISESEDEGLLGNFVFGTDGGKYDTIIIRHGGARHLYPETISEDYKDAFGNIRNDGCFFMNGSEVFTFSASRAPKMIRDTLEKNNILQENVKLFVLHQANRIILETIFKKLSVRNDQELFCLKNQGNTVQSTIPIALKEAMEKGLIKKGDKLILAGFGVGLSWAATSMTL
ncbi:MAG: ketoacyl-ACP synthase III [Bacteroidales bacterium]|nr:ketoacyl-ACP synthase III [Bacteroidales bacterium]MCF8343020.1 ketoacyl-ACP synthase III [Bacteroidales bacterium]MCF8350260.1 ketoacyl-ACP synthase III [Bacteroidales bacterium]MCF8375992.1 ketoacyl-ACP synthase III [Bacteroidales bacterium]MCF8400480.1 ketoacyl-ACP synthase III [Bacteroidales bacterium]